jgi:hypothetical protein
MARDTTEYTTAEPVRETTRYSFAIPMMVELPNGLFRQSDRTDAVLVDLSQGGAAMVAMADDRIRERKRFRVIIDDHAGIIEVRNVVAIEGGRVRFGAAFKSLGLELQELVADALENAVAQSSRLMHVHDPFIEASDLPVHLDAA